MHKPFFAKFSLDKRTLITAEDIQFIIWDVETSNILRKIPREHEGLIVDDPENKQHYVPSVKFNPYDNSVFVIVDQGRARSFERKANNEIEGLNRIKHDAVLDITFHFEGAYTATEDGIYECDIYNGGLLDKVASDE